MTKARESADEFFDNSLFRLNKKYLQLLGRWPYQDRKQGILIVFTICITLLSVVIPEVIYFIEVFKDTNKMLDCIPALILTYAAYVMIFNSIVNFDKMKEILDMFKNNWDNLKDEQELKIFQKYAKEGSIIIAFYSVSMILTLTSFSAAQLFPKFLDLINPLNESRPLKNLLEVEYYVDPQRYFVPIYLHGLQAAFSVVFTILTVDAQFVMIIQNACSMFVVLGYRIKNVGRRNSKEFNEFVDHDRDKQISDKISECTAYHSDCIRYAELVEDSFAISWFMQLFPNMIVISITGVQTITRTDEPEQMFKCGLNTVCIIFRLFYISWPGQKILDHSAQVHEFLCNAAWYDFPSRAKKMMLLMLLRTTRPCNITAGKLIPINFETYCTMIQTSMSYFTMILSTQ